MRIVFMGTPEFSVPTLNKIVDRGYTVVAAYTRAPKPGGRRGLETRKTPVHEVAELHGIPVYTPASLNSKEAQDVFKGHLADVAAVVAYGLLLPRAILQAPKFGCINLHASLLPRWRGAAPIQRAIMAGDAETGVDLMRIEVGLDTGPVAMREVIRIRPQDTAGDLSARMAEIAARLAAEGLVGLENGTLKFQKQPNEGICYAHKVVKGESEINWGQSDYKIRNHIHGLSPTPGAFSFLRIEDRLERIKIYRAEVVVASGDPGTVLDREMTVACSEGAVRVLEAQRSGQTVLPGRELMRRDRIRIGWRFMPSEKT